MTSLPILFGYDISGLGTSSPPYDLCSHWNQRGMQSTLYGPSISNSVRGDFLRPLMGSIRKKLTYRFGKRKDILKMTEDFFFKKESANPYVHLWAGLSLEIFERLHAHGNKIILERINCHQATAKKLIDEAHYKYGLLPPATITRESIDIEKRKLELAEGIFTPSPMVYKSMVENGVNEGKLIRSSYGWSPTRFPNRTSIPSKKPTFLFVGTLCVRKGVPLLLKAWEKAAIDGNLIFCGQMDDTIRTHFAHYFDNDTILHVPYTPNLTDYYNRADAFVFPSYEEGGPLVTYEAMAHGLVPLVSEMGGGAIVKNRKNGLIIDLEVDDWATAIMAVSANSGKREKISKAARASALEFTWEKVAGRRADSLCDKFPTLWDAQVN